MTEKTIDPIFAPSVLEHAMAMFDDVNFDALKAEPRLEGVVDKNPKTAAIILAGGSGERFGHEGGKQLVEIAGKPILTRSAEVFDAVGDVGLIVIVCPEERMSEYLSKAIDPFPFVTPIVMAPAGSIRQESAFSGLELVPEEYEFVMLHDGARPLITKELIEHTISTLKGNIDCDGALVGHPSIDTLKVVENGVVVGTPTARCSGTLKPLRFSALASTAALMLRPSPMDLWVQTILRLLNVWAAVCSWLRESATTSNSPFLKTI